MEKELRDAHINIISIIDKKKKEAEKTAKRGR